MNEWATARAAYEAGESLRAIGASVGVSHTTIRKRARAEGWERSPNASASTTCAVQVETSGDGGPGQPGFPAESGRPTSKGAGDARSPLPVETPPSPSPAPPDFTTPEGCRRYEARLLGVDEEGQRRIDRAFDDDRAEDTADAERRWLRNW